MALPFELVPLIKRRVIDVVRDAGVSVTDWETATDPRYCFEWSFIKPDVLVVLNLWIENMVEVDGDIVQRLNFNDGAAVAEKRTVRGRRRARMEMALAIAQEQQLPIRVIVLAREPVARLAAGRSSRTSARDLDSMPWAVESFDRTTGQAVVLRCGRPPRHADQFSLRPPPDGDAERRDGTKTSTSRSAMVRRFVLERARGKCELCGAVGFDLPDGRIYLETHHVVSLANFGGDGVGNVVAICPNDHRRAHHGRDALKIREELQRRLALSTCEINSATQTDFHLSSFARSSFL